MCVPVVKYTSVMLSATHRKLKIPFFHIVTSCVYTRRLIHAWWWSYKKNKKKKLTLTHCMDHTMYVYVRVMKNKRVRERKGFLCCAMPHIYIKLNSGNRFSRAVFSPPCVPYTNFIFVCLYEIMRLMATIKLNSIQLNSTQLDSFFLYINLFARFLMIITNSNWNYWVLEFECIFFENWKKRKMTFFYLFVLFYGKELAQLLAYVLTGSCNCNLLFLQ